MPRSFEIGPVVPEKKSFKVFFFLNIWPWWQSWSCNLHYLLSQTVSDEIFVDDGRRRTADEHNDINETCCGLSIDTKRL